MLTKPQNEQLASKLHGTTQNVYVVARSLFGCEFDDEDFDRLKADTGVFRCEECSEWLNVEHEAKGFPYLCNGCLEGM